MRLLALAGSLLAVFVAPSAAATLLFEGDFESGDILQWSKAQIVAPDRIQIVKSPLRQGSYAARVEVRQGDDPINASGNRAELVWTKNPETEGAERWYGWSTLWPNDYPSAKTWQLFVQWHHSGCCGSPPMEFYVNGETIQLRVNASTVVWNQPLVRGKWHDFVFHAKWSSNPGIGYVELWYDGNLVVPKTYGANLYAGEVNYMKMGLYRNETIQPVGVIFHDAMKVATTREEVELSEIGIDAGSPEPEPDAEPEPEPEVDAGAAGASGSSGSASTGGAGGQDAGASAGGTVSDNPPSLGSPDSGSSAGLDEPASPGTSCSATPNPSSGSARAWLAVCAVLLAGVARARRCGLRSR